MSLTVNTEPDDQHAAYQNVVFEVTTDKTATNVETNDGTQESLYIAGKIQFNTPVATSFVVGDIITGSGFTDSRLNRKHQILRIDGLGSDQITVSTDWDAIYAGDLGTLTRTNDNFQVRADVHELDTGFVNISQVNINPFGSKLFVSNNTNFEVGGLVKVTGTTSYNGIHKVLVKDNIGGDHIVIDVPFVADETGEAYPSELIASKRVTELNSEFTFNVANILQSILSYNIGSLVGIFPNLPNSVKDYAILFTEEYLDETGVLEEFDYIESAEHEVINATRQHTEDQDIFDYLLLNGTKKFLTNAPELTIDDSEDVQYHFIINDSLSNVRYSVQKYDNTGTPIGVAQLGTVENLTRHRAVLYLNNSLWDASTAYIEFKIVDSIGTTDYSETVRLNISRGCYSEPVRFYWLNRLGGFDAYTFTGDYEESVIIDRVNYQRPKGLNFLVSDRGTGTAYVTAEKEKSIFSDYVNRSTALWLEELFTSPHVFIKENGSYIPVVMTNKNQIIEGTNMIQFIAEYKLSNNIVVQNG